MKSDREWGSEVSNFLIVESKNDELFLKALIDHLNLSYIQVDSHPICHIDDFECMEGLNSRKLEERLSALKNQLPKRDIKSIGIIIDHDGKREDRINGGGSNLLMNQIQSNIFRVLHISPTDLTHYRINLINEAIGNIFTAEEKMLKTGRFISVFTDIGDDRFSFQTACYLMNVNEKGELETVLKAVKSKDSPYADCLDAWRECVEKRLNATSQEEKRKVLSDKEFDKFWLNNYIRFDTCDKKEKKQAERKCSIGQFEYIMKNKKDIFDFDNPILEDLKRFLSLFKNYEM